MKEFKVKITADTGEAGEKLDKLTEKTDKLVTKVEQGNEKNKKSFADFSQKLVGVGDQIGKLGAGVAAGFTLATGAVGAFGDSLGYSSEEIAAAQAKATSFIGILASIKPLFEGITAGVGLAGKAFTALGVLVAANPIGAIITAIGLVIATVIIYFDEIKAAGVAAAEFIADNWEYVATILFPIPGLITLITEAFIGSEDASVEAGIAGAAAAEAIANASAKAAGSMVGDFNEIYDARRKSLQKEREAIDSKYLFERSLAVANGENLEALDKAYLESKLKTIQKELELEIIRFNQVQKLRGEDEDKFFDIEGITNDARKKASTERLQALQDEKLAVTQTLNDILQDEKDANQASVDAYKEKLEKERELALFFDQLAKDDAKKAADDIAKIKIAGESTFWQWYTKLQEDNLKAQADAQVIADEAEAERVAMQKQGVLDYAEFLTSTELGQLDKRKEFLKQYLDEGKLTQDEYDAYIAKSNENQRALTNARLDIVSSGFDAISSLTELFGKNSEEGAKKAFNVNKAVGIAQAGIQTYQSAQGAYLSQLTIPSPDAPIRASIAAGIAVVAGLANIAKIAATKFEGGSKPSAATPSVGGLPSSSSSAAAPSFNLFGQANQGSQVSQANSVNGNSDQNGPQVIRAYVSETDISATQNRLHNIRTNAEL